MKKLLMTILTMNILLIGCGPIESSCGKNKSDLCYTLLGQDDVDQGDYREDQEELEKFKEQVLADISDLNVSLDDQNYSLQELREDMNGSNNDLLTALQGTRDQLQGAISALEGSFESNQGSTSAVLRGFRRKINRLRNSIRKVRNNVQDLSVACDYLDLGFLQLATYCSLER
jgi:chromosome segregation ATPase